MLPNVLFGLLLIGLSGGLWWRQVQVRRLAEARGSSEREVSFARRQYRIRLQVSILLAVIGGAIIGGVFMKHPLLALGYWTCVVVLVLWIGVLALADLAGTHTHFRALSDEHAAEHAALRVELEKHLAAKDNATSNGQET